MTKRVDHEGSVYSKFGQLIRDVGYSKPVNIEIATVVEAPPNLRLKLDADGLELEKDDLVVAEHLTRHDRIISINYEYPKTWNIVSDIGDMQKDAGSSRNNISHADSVPYEKFLMQNAKLTFEDVLKPGDRVIVACLDEDMIYVVLDRAVWY
ncbi:DUF2577 domain-containing protein [Cytobacillus massiliigabonensis]|uniref:DUF2577 domain-containing protein n=1 Tax=Cytobacillus massiliigabonensis TaxID=1871011 RepID=UPI0015E0CE73|nr:DUF2577 domain-containing protein [Cytobacillus massiliigabonensis]